MYQSAQSENYFYDWCQRMFIPVTVNARCNKPGISNLLKTTTILLRGVSGFDNTIYMYTPCRLVYMTHGPPMLNSIRGWLLHHIRRVIPQSADLQDSVTSVVIILADHMPPQYTCGCELISFLSRAQRDRYIIDINGDTIKCRDIFTKWTGKTELTNQNTRSTRNNQKSIYGHTSINVRWPWKDKLKK